MIDALIAGRIYGKPLSRNSASGNAFVTAKVRAITREGETMFVNVIAFAPTTVAVLLALGDGDSVALSGELTPKVYVPLGGEPRPSLDLVAHSVLSEYHVQRRRRAVQATAEREPADTSAHPFDDPLPAFTTGTQR